MKLLSLLLSISCCSCQSIGKTDNREGYSQDFAMDAVRKIPLAGNALSERAYATGNKAAFLAQPLEDSFLVFPFDFL